MPFRDFWLYAGGLLVLVGFGAGEPAVMGIGAAVVVVGALGRLWNRQLFLRTRLSWATGERFAFQGEPIPLEVSLENAKLVPLPWFEWRLTLSEPFTADGEQLAAGMAPGLSWLVRRGALGWYAREQWRFTLRAAQRGYFQVGPARLNSGDLLGLFPRELPVDHVEHVTVYPRILRLEDLGIPADRPFGDLRGRNRLFEDPQRFTGLREYQHGDPLRRVDWKATARSGELQSRLYEPSATAQFYLLINIDTLAHSWEGYLKDELEATVETAASVAAWAAERRYAVGLLANGSFPGADRPIRLAPSRSPGQLTRLLEALAVIQPLTMGDLATAIEKERGRMPLGSTIVLIAALLPQPLMAAMLRLRDEGHRVAIIATAPRAQAEADGDTLAGIPFIRTRGAFAKQEVVR